MEYEVINELDNFDYHDAIINKIYFQNEHLIWEVSNINATTENSQNNLDEHMCVENAIMIFEDAHIESIVLGAYQVYDSNNVLIESKEPINLLPEEYDAFLEEKNREEGSYIFCMESLSKLDNGQYRVGFEISGCIIITFSKSIILWDNFKGKAWYEDEKFKKYIEERQKSWMKFITDYKMGDIMEAKIKDIFPPWAVVELLPSLIGNPINISENNKISVGEVHKVQITDINEKNQLISLALFENKN